MTQGTLHSDAAPRRGGAAGERWLIALAAGILLSIYALGKLWPNLTFSPVGGGWLGEVVVFLAAAGLLSLMLISPARSRTTPRRRLALMAIRLAVVLLMLLIMLRPALVYSSVSRRSATIALLIDTSGSMKSTDTPDRTSRYEQLRKTLEKAAGDLAELGEAVTIKAYAFDSELRELVFADGRISLPDAPEGDQSAIGWSLSELLKQLASQRLAAVVLLSDGNQRALAPRHDDPVTVAARMKARQQPILGVIFGRSDAQATQRDLVLDTLKANDSVHVKNRLAVTGEARVIGYPDPQQRAELLWETSPGKMEVVETAPFRPRPDGALSPFDIAYAPTAAGLHKMTLRLAGREGELDASNNEQSTIIRVSKGGLAVLYLEGAVRLESRNILRSLGSGQNIQVDFVRLDAQHPDKRPSAADQTLSDGLKPAKYDVFILGDLAASAFKPGKDGQPSELQLLSQRVRDGAGLMMLGGLHSFGPGRYFETPLEDIVPVKMYKLEQQDFGAALRADKHLPPPVRPRPTPEAAGNFLNQLTAPEKNAALWLALPPLLNGANKLENNGGVVLLDDGNGNPLLIARTAGVGSGRAIAFAGDSTWRWIGHGHEEAHKRFWRQLAIWLGRKDQDKDGPVWVLASERNVFVNQAIDLSAGATGLDGKPLVDFELTAELIRRDEQFKEASTEKLTFNRQAEKRTHSFKPTQPGDYLLKVRTVIGDKTHTAEERFLVREPKQLEMQNVVPDLATMQRMAHPGAPGDGPSGLVVSPGEFDKVLARLKQIPRALEDEVRTISSLWDPLRVGPLAWLGLDISLAALCGFGVALLLSLEWFLRKRWGLV